MTQQLINPRYPETVQYKLHNGHTVFIEPPQKMKFANEEFAVVPLGLFDILNGEIRVNYDRHFVDYKGNIYNMNIDPYPYKLTQKLNGRERVQLRTRFSYYEIHKTDAKNIFDIASGKIANFRSEMIDNIIEKAKEYTEKEVRNLYEIESPVGTFYADNKEDRDNRIKWIRERGVGENNILVKILDEDYHRSSRL